MEKIITIIYGLGLIGNSIYKYQLGRDIGSMVFEAVAGFSLVAIAISMGSTQMETTFLSYYLALGIGFVLVIFFAVGLWKIRSIYSVVQLLISLIFFIAGLFILGGIA
jgi:hypothetical protein